MGLIRMLVNDYDHVRIFFFFLGGGGGGGFINVFNLNLLNVHPVTSTSIKEIKDIAHNILGLTHLAFCRG